MEINLPKKIQVIEVLYSRYQDSGNQRSGSGARPSSWDLRINGVDIVRSVEGDLYRLLSYGNQSCPKPGWVIVLTEARELDSAHGEEHAADQPFYLWTLYGLPKEIDQAAIN